REEPEMTIALFEFAQFREERGFFRAAVRVEEKQVLRQSIGGRLAQDADEWRDADAARDEDRRARTRAVQQQRSEGPVQLESRSHRGGRQRPLERTVAQPCRDRELALGWRAHQ